MALGHALARPDLGEPDQLLGVDGKLLVPEAGAVSIVAEERHELSDGAEVVLHQVRVAVPPERMPDDAGARRALRHKLVGLAEIWARRCIHERHADITEL